MVASLPGSAMMRAPFSKSMRVAASESSLGASAKLRCTSLSFINNSIDCRSVGESSKTSACG
jgi:hypothetical protein